MRDRVAMFAFIASVAALGLLLGAQVAGADIFWWIWR